MRKVLLLLIAIFSVHASHAQYGIFKHAIENKLLCKEDRFVYFLENNSFSRDGNTFYHQYVENGQIYNSKITYDNPCYVIYNTDNVEEYKRIAADVKEVSEKRYTSDKREYYVCDTRNVHNVQIIFLGFLPRAGAYEIKVYQNPDWEEISY